MTAEASSRPGIRVGPTSEFALLLNVGQGHAPRKVQQDSPGFRPGDDGLAIAVVHEARFVPFDDTRLLVATLDDPAAAERLEARAMAPLLADAAD